MNSWVCMAEDALRLQFVKGRNQRRRTCGTKTRFVKIGPRAGARLRLGYASSALHSCEGDHRHRPGQAFWLPGFPGYSCATAPAFDRLPLRGPRMAGKPRTLVRRTATVNAPRLAGIPRDDQERMAPIPIRHSQLPRALSSQRKLETVIGQPSRDGGRRHAENGS